MKNLNDYILEKLYNQQINEKLVINKNYNPINFVGSEPSDSGICIKLRFNSTRFTNKESEDIRVYRETYKKEGTNLIKGRMSEYRKNKYGFFYENIDSDSYSLLLFNDDAKLFLNMLLKHPRMYFMWNDFPIEEKTSGHPWRDFMCVKNGGHPFGNNYFTKDELRKLIDDIK